ncbi:Antigen KI-67 [Schistosoma japonicum]|uniref:Antigen KI-67 n=1 Tax=Schistosoma japonicum TaxID=6182 RepID=A0A4Z2DB34_SCHJA|nr:Antigen KI-67 [Schistosoma japonicum]
MNPSGHIVVIRRDGTDGLTCDWCSPLCDIGSNQSCDIRVQHSTVAPFHCTLQLMGNGLVQAVSRVDGKYKMLVNDFPLKDACVLTNNSVLTVGDRQFRFLYPSIRKLTTGDYLCETSYHTPIYHGKEEILTPNSLPVVYPSKRSSSKRNPPDSAVRSPRQRSTTPKRTLGTSERYGPVPPRQPATPPIIQVLRHEPNSSQTVHPYQFRTENEESTKQNATYGCYEGMEVSKSRRLSNQPKSCTISNFSISTSPPSSKLSSSVKVGPHDHIRTSVTPSLPSDGLNCTTKKNSSPGFRKSFHKLLILNESSKHSKLCDVDQLYDELSCVQQNSIENKNLPPNRQRNQLFYGESLNNSIEKSSHDSIPEMLTSPSSSITTRKSSVNSSRKINVACSLETVQKSDYRSNKRTIVDKIYSAADDKPTPKRRRGVSFGPPLSPEQFDKSLPPSTPVKRGETPLAKLSHSTPACHNLQTTPVVPRQATPFSSKAKLSQISQLSIFSETTLESPNYNTTNNRVSAVISLPPTPDTNLLNSLSTNSSYPSTSVAAYPVTSAAYSAPIKTSVNRLTFKRRSLGFAETPDKTPSPKVPPTSPASNKPIKRHRLKYRQQNTKKLGKRARSLHFPINKPNTKTRYKKNYISVPDLTLEKQIRKRRRDRSSSVPPTQLSETEPSTPNRSLLSASKSSGLTGVRKLMRTPKPMETPRVSGVSELFVEESIGKRRRGRPSSVPPTQLSETEPSTPNRSLLSASKSSGLTGVRKLMRTPKPMETPRVSGVSELFVEESIGKRRRGRPSSVPPTQLSETEPSTPNKSLLSASKSSGLTGVRKLMRTPKPMETPRVSGVSELFVEESIGKRRRGRPSSVPPTQLSETEPSTPNKSLLSASKSSGLTGVRKLMRTPKPMETPRVSGVSELFVEESIGKRRRGRPSSVPPTQLSETEPSTPNKSLLSASKSSGLTGVRKLMRTPKPMETPRVSGVSELFVEESIGKRRRGRPSSVPPTQLSETEPSTPNKSLLSASKSSGLTGVRKLMRTPKPMETPRVSGVSELFVEESIGKRRRGRPSSVPPTQLSETEPSTPNKSLLSASKSSGLTGVRKLMRTPKPMETPRVSGVSELFVEESIGKRRRGRPSSVPPTQLSETEPSTPNKSLLSASKSSGLTGVRKLMRTPKPMETPRVSGVSELFVEESIGKRRRGRPSSVPPTQLSETEPSTPNKSLLSASKSSGLTGVRKLMRTPKPMETPRVSGVSELFVEESIGKRRRGRPSSVPPTQLSETEPSTPNKSLLSASKSSGLTGVRKLMRTPKPMETPRVSGVSELFVEESIGKRRRGRPSSVPPTQLSETEPSTPNKSLLSASKSSGLTGVRKLMRTPKPMETPRVSGVSELFVEESIGKRRRGRPSSVPPTQLSETEPSTPNKSLLSASKSSGLTGVRKLMRTPKPMETPRVSGVSELFVEESIGKRRRGRPSSVPPTQLSETEPSTPNKSLLSASKSSGLTGVRKLMRTPKPMETPRVSGVSELFVEESIGKRRRGRPSSVPPTQLSETEPSTPNKSLLSASKSSGLTGVRKLMRTPKPMETPRVSGRRRGRPSSVPPTQLSETEPSTPNKSLLSASKSSGLTGVRKLMRTPKPMETPRISGVSELFVEESIGKRRRADHHQYHPLNCLRRSRVLRIRVCYLHRRVVV